MTHITFANTWTDPETGTSYEHDQTADVAPATARILIARGKARAALAADIERFERGDVEPTEIAQPVDVESAPEAAADESIAADAGDGVSAELEAAPVAETPTEPTGAVETAGARRRGGRSKEAGSAS